MFEGLAVRTQRIEALTRLGFEVVESLRDEVMAPSGGEGPFRRAAGDVILRYGPVTRRERWLMRWAGPPADASLQPTEAALTRTHLYARFAGLGGDVLVRLPRTSLEASWRHGKGACYGLTSGPYVTLPVRKHDALLEALDQEIADRPHAPFRSVGFIYADAITTATTTLPSLVMLTEMRFPAVVLGLMSFSFIASWLGRSHVLVTTEGLTREVGWFLKWTRKVPRAAIHSVVIRLSKRRFASIVTIELEVRDAKNVPKHYVIARAATKEPPREYAERMMAPEARRVASLLGAGGPRWEES